jgi:hypothetical protein
MLPMWGEPIMAGCPGGSQVPTAPPLLDEEGHERQVQQLLFWAPGASAEQRSGYGGLIVMGQRYQLPMCPLHSRVMLDGVIRANAAGRASLPAPNG